MLLACSLLNALELTCRLWKRCGLQILGVRTTLVWTVFQTILPCANSLVPRLGGGGIMFAVIFYEIMQSSPTQWEKAACFVLSMRPEEYSLEHSVIIWVNLPHIQQNV